MEARTEWVAQRPSPALAPLIERYIGYRLTGFGPGLHRGLPSRHMTMIVSIGAQIDVIAHTDPAQSPGRYRAVLGGLQASHALIAHSGAQEGVAIELTPVGCRALFGMPAAELWSTSLELGDVVGSAGTELWERLQEAEGWQERFRVCDHVLGRLVRDDSLEPALRRSWQLLVASAGTAPGGGHRRHGRLDAPALRAPVPRGVRPRTQARRPCGALRARPPDARSALSVRLRRSRGAAATSTRRT